jgi:hypothetical protein
VGQRSLRTDTVWAFHFGGNSVGPLQLVVFVDFERKAIALCCPLESELNAHNGLLSAVAAYVLFAKVHVLGQSDFTFAGWVYGALGASILLVDNGGNRGASELSLERALVANVP